MIVKMITAMMTMIRRMIHMIEIRLMNLFIRSITVVIRDGEMFENGEQQKFEGLGLGVTVGIGVVEINVRVGG